MTTITSISVSGPMAHQGRPRQNPESRKTVCVCVCVCVCMCMCVCLLMFHINYLKDVLYSDLSTELVESVVNKELCTVGQVAVSIGSRDSCEYNSRRWPFVARMIVVLCLVNPYNGLKCHQHQNNYVVLAQHKMHTVNFWWKFPQHFKANLLTITYKLFG